MTIKTEAIKIQKEIMDILAKNAIHNKVEYVRSPDLKFINLEASIKITKE